MESGSESPIKHPRKTFLSWYVPACLSFVFFTFGTFLCGRTSFNPWATKFMASVGYLIFFGVAVVWAWISYLREHKVVPSIYDSTLFAVAKVESDGTKKHKLAPGVVLGLLGGVLTFLGQVSMFLGFYADPNGRGITTSIITGVGIVAALAAFIVYHERLSAYTVIGIVLSTAGIVVITLQSGLDGTILGVLGGFGALTGFAAKNFISRPV
jgi:drug/metabolite transporter (DMT)-like permease